MYIVPQPKRIYIEKEGLCTISEEYPIIIPQYNESDFYSARQLKKKIKEVTAVDISIEAHKKLGRFEKYILLLNFSNCKGKYEDYSIDKYKNQIRNEGYILEITNEKVVVISLDSKGLYYGVQTLRQLINNTRNLSLPLIKIIDYPDFDVRGVMLDVSRDWMPDFNTLKNLIYDLSEFKINHLELYIEPHVFKTRRHPVISKGWGYITAEELMELEKICTRCHIDFVPNLQSFGHNSRVLMCKEYEHLAEDPEIKGCLSPAVNETYDFLEDLYSEFLPLFKSSFFNVGCDETFEIQAGNGKSKELSKAKGTSGVYFGYVERIRELAAAYGKQIMIWADQITHKKDESYLNGAMELPKDIVLINWWYDPEWDYDENEKILEKTGCRHMFCTGTSSWVRFYPEYSRAKRNILNFAAVAQKYNTMGIIISDWGDAGHVNLLEQSYYGFIYGANVAWNVNAEDDEYFDRAFCLNFVRDEECSFSKLNNILCSTYDTSRRDNDYRNVLFDICFFDGLISDEYVNKKDRALVCWGDIDRSKRASEYTDSQRIYEVEKLLKEASEVYREINTEEWKRKLLCDEIGYTLKQMIFACKKYNFIKAMEDENYDINKMIQELEQLLVENIDLQKTFTELWFRTGHPEGVSIHMERFNWVSRDIRMTIEELSEKVREDK